MKYKLLKPMNPSYNAVQQILTNRGIKFEDIEHYLNTSDADINNPTLLGEDLLKQAATALIKHIQLNDKCFILCDCDCDGFTSAATLANYLYDLFPEYVKTRVTFGFHEGKQHGLSDVVDAINESRAELIIVPDAGSNDFEYHKLFINKGIDLIVLDHHLSEVSEDSNGAIIINNQLSEYPNKDFSGVGITWQFCRYLDNLMGTNYADNYLDLVALGNTGDMMSLLSIETKHLINKGFEPENIHNPYIYEMWQKNKFKLGEHITSIDAAFYIVPMINAVQRSGDLEEKELLFKSMLKFEAFENILSNKRGHAIGEMERVVDQAVRMSTNVKNRQTRTQDASLEYLEGLIEKNNLLDHKVLLFTLEPNKVDKNIAGLIANKFAAKYQRPCCILTKVETQESDHKVFLEDINQEVLVLGGSEVKYQGSARGYEMSGITTFKDICDEAGAEWTAGHQNAFGLSIKENDLDSFLEKTDKLLEDMSSEPIYYVDYIYNGADVKPDDILSISNLNSLWGKDMNEAYIAIKDLKISPNMVTVFRKTSNTLKITLSNKVSIMKFNATDEECDKLQNQTGAYIQLDIVGKCNTNEWMGNVTPQVFMEAYEITGQGKYLF